MSGPIAITVSANDSFSQLLAAQRFRDSLLEARVIIEDWHVDYNRPPHNAYGGT